MSAAITMDDKIDHILLKSELDDEDKIHITEVFFEDVVAKLAKMQARTGTLNCDFAGEQYGSWNIHFKSTRLGFDIVDFEYDKESRSFNLDPGKQAIRKCSKVNF